VGADLSLPVLIERMLGSEEGWKPAVSFCETVMLQKEATERIRRQEAAGAATDSSEEESEEEEE